MNKSGKRSTRTRKKATPKVSITFIDAEQMYLVICNGRRNKYGIGSKVPKGSCAYKEERGAWTAETLADAKQMAEDFASNMRAPE